MKRTFTVCLLVILINIKGWSQVSVSGRSGLAVNRTSLTNAGGLLAAINGTAQTGNVGVIISGDLTTEAGVAALNASNFTTTAEESAVSTSGPNIGFFHFKPGVAIQAESGAATISGSPNDFKSDVTHSTTPGIGAGAFTGIIGCTAPTWTGSISTDWNVADNWCNGLVPDATAAVMIPINSSGIYPLISLADAVAASVTINGGASLTMSGAYNLTLSTSAAFINNGTFTGAASTGAIVFAGTGTVVGAVNFNNVTINGVVDFGTASTVNGNLTINSGGAAGGIFGTSLINYGAASTLIYNTILSTGNEWYTGGSGTIAPGAGIPQNVTILSGTITIPNSGGANRALAGNLIINSGSTLQMTAGTRDIYIGGNWTNTGAFNANTRTVTFNGSGFIQTIAGATTFYNITLQNSVLFGSSVTTISNTFSNSAGIMDGGTSTVIFTGSAGSIIGGNSKNFYNLKVNSGANITHTTGGGNVSINNSYTNNGTYTEGPTYTTYFDKVAGTPFLIGSGTTTFGNVTIGKSGTVGSGTILSANAHSFTVSGTAFTFNHSNSTFAGGSSIVTFSGTKDTIKTALNVTGTIAAFYGVTVLNTTTLGIDIAVNGPLSIMNATDKLAINGKTLSLNGTVSGAGTLTGSSTSNIGVGSNGLLGTLYFDQTTNSITNVLKDFTVNLGASATIGNVLNITAGISPGTVTANGTINTGNYLVLRSNINGTSRVAASLGAINGNVTVERYIAVATVHSKSWQLLAIPHNGLQTINNAWQEGCAVNVDCKPGFGTQITGAGGTVAGFDVYSLLPSMKTWVPGSSTYAGVSGTGIPIANQKGYFLFVRGDRSVNSISTTATTPTTLRTQGPLFTSTNLPPLTNIGVKQTESVGNPYASAIDKRKIGLMGVDSFFIVWDPKLGGAYGLGAFQYFAWDGTDYTVTPGGGSYSKGGSINNNIESGQAFFVQTTKTAGTVSFSETAKVSGSLLVNSPVQDPQSQQLLRTNLYGVNVDGSTFMVDGTLQGFGPEYTNGVDGQDARKNANTAENLSISVSRNSLSIERRRMVSEQDTIFLILTGGVRPQPYRYEFIAQNMNVGALQGFVEDTYLHEHTPIDLNGTTLIDFTIEDVSGSYAPDRFRVVFTEVASGPLPLTFTSVKASRQGTMINVEWKVENERNIKEYEVEKSAEGLHFKTMVTKAATGNRGNSASYLAADVQPVKDYNYYRIRCNDKDGKSQVSKVVRVFAGTINQDINIYPNPITDGMIQLQFMNEPEGKYGLRLLNKIGQVILSKQVTLMDGSSTELIKWNFNLAHGMYQLEITKPDGKIKNINVMY